MTDCSLSKDAIIELMKRIEKNPTPENINNVAEKIYEMATQGRVVEEFNIEVNESRKEQIKELTQKAGYSLTNNDISKIYQNIKDIEHILYHSLGDKEFESAVLGTLDLKKLGLLWPADKIEVEIKLDTIKGVLHPELAQENIGDEEIEKLAEQFL